jgi:hypothetical protein
MPGGVGGGSWKASPYPDLPCSQKVAQVLYLANLPILPEKQKYNLCVERTMNSTASAAYDSPPTSLYIPIKVAHELYRVLQISSLGEVLSGVYSQEGTAGCLD